MNIGIGCNSILDKKGHYEKFDGIGNYTLNVVKELKKNNKLVIKPCFFNFPKDLLVKKESPELAVYQNVFLPDIFPLYSFGNLEAEINLFHSTDHLIPKLKRTPIVATIHDATLFKGISYKNSWLRKFKNSLLKKHSQYADHVIAVSNAVVPDLIEYWEIEPKKISVIYNGIDPCWFEVIKPEIKTTILKKNNLNKKFILSVGTLYPKKNIERVLLAYLALPAPLREEYDLVIVGKKGWQCDELVEKIKTEQAKGHVKWLDYVPFDELRAIYQAASLLVFVSLEEGFGFPIIEGFASKVPVLTSNVSSMPEIAGDAATLVDPTSIEAIKAAMQITLETKNADAIEHGFSRAQEFSWKKNAEALASIYARYDV